MVAGPTPAANVTRDGIEIKPGQIWADLDKRMSGRRVEVLSVTDGRAEVRRVPSGGITHLSVRRMYRHSTGWQLVKDTSSTAAQGNPASGAQHDELHSGLVATLAAAEEMGIAVSDISFEERDGQLVAVGYTPEGEITGTWSVQTVFHPITDQEVA